MKFKVNRFIYFLSPRLQINAAEKTTVLTLASLLLLLSGGQQLLSADGHAAYDAPYYAERIALFETRAQEIKEELSALEQQYYPDTAAITPSEAAPAQPETTGSTQNADSQNISVSSPAAENRVVRQEAPAQSDKVNINTASSQELESLPGIGPAIAGRIIEHRNTHGPFQRIEDIKNVRGIAEGRFDAIKDLITVGETDPE